MGSERERERERSQHALLLDSREVRQVKDACIGSAENTGRSSLTTTTTTTTTRVSRKNKVGAVARPSYHSPLVYFKIHRD